MLHLPKLYFLTFYLRADTAYSVHSPFVYKLATCLIDKKQLNHDDFSKALKDSFRPQVLYYFRNNMDVKTWYSSEDDGPVIFILDSSFLLLQADFKENWNAVQATWRFIILRDIRKTAEDMRNWKTFYERMERGVSVDAWNWACYADLPGQKELLSYCLVPSHWKPISYRQFFPHVKQA